MNGIEYSAFANSIIKKETKNSGNSLRQASTKSNESSMSNSVFMNLNLAANDFDDSSTSSTAPRPSQEFQQTLTDILRQKLKSMNECPDYLVPKCSLSNSFYSSTHSNVSSSYSAGKKSKNKYLNLGSNQVFFEQIGFLKSNEHI